MAKNLSVFLWVRTISQWSHLHQKTKSQRSSCMDNQLQHWNLSHQVNVGTSKFCSPVLPTHLHTDRQIDRNVCTSRSGWIEHMYLAKLFFYFNHSFRSRQPSSRQMDVIRQWLHINDFIIQIFPNLYLNPIIYVARQKKFNYQVLMDEGTAKHDGRVFFLDHYAYNM